MSSKRRYEGEMTMDNRYGPGVPDEMVLSAGLPVGAGRGLFEAATITCSHCQYVFLKNPQRIRERAYCRKCDHYICDGCGAALAQSGICRPFKQIMDEAQEQAALDEQRTKRGIFIPATVKD